ncbi:hypothetical protein IWQ56_006198 [Coemansia nantahalensis]|uniref:Uncharacterized protein n=1 Tax=Coemansia nantahalensis TaxID=2789366 RepID=A0ACC1K1L4_9FUNG|nr:hypothetical protein IWQ56_006198 [Coemansia nantahalensis]KAJ2771402.1 hypothetical protein IWQ57_002228 [Coemansia nantahalensis]
MLLTRPLFAQRRRARFGDQSLPRLDAVPPSKLFGMSRRNFCWTVIIVTIPFIVVTSSILYKRLVLGEEKRKTLHEGGVDAGYVLDNIASSGSAARSLEPPPDRDQRPGHK